MAAIDFIVSLLEKQHDLSIKEIVEQSGFSKQMVHVAINQLLEQGKVKRLGKAPKTIYRKADASTAAKKDHGIDEDKQEFLKKEFIQVTETGNLIAGEEAFAYWCYQRKLPVTKTLDEFIKTKAKYEQFYETSGIINGYGKLKNTEGYDKIWLDQLYYLDFYAIERFGKTKLGTLLHFAKQGQNKFLMQMLMKEIDGRVKEFVSKQRIDAVVFVPPTIRREVQLMKFIQTKLNLSLPVIQLKKISGIIPIPQKSLSKLSERIANADNSFAVTETRKFNHVLMIDDAVGSGSTLNQIAQKLKQKEVAKKITGLAVVGSFKGFDVITDV